jgi:hypothetical protein
MYCEKLTGSGCFFRARDEVRPGGRRRDPEILSVIQHPGVDKPWQRHQFVLPRAGLDHAREIFAAVILEVLVQWQRPLSSGEFCDPDNIQSKDIRITVPAGQLLN